MKYELTVSEAAVIDKMRLTPDVKPSPDVKPVDEIITEDLIVDKQEPGRFVTAKGVRVSLPDDCSYTSTIMADGSTEYVVREKVQP